MSLPEDMDKLNAMFDAVAQEFLKRNLHVRAAVHLCTDKKGNAYTLVWGKLANAWMLFVEKDPDMAAVPLGSLSMEYRLQVPNRILDLFEEAKKRDHEQGLEARRQIRLMQDVLRKITETEVALKFGEYKLSFDSIVTCNICKISTAVSYLNGVARCEKCAGR